MTKPHVYHIHYTERDSSVEAGRNFPIVRPGWYVVAGSYAEAVRLWQEDYFGHRFADVVEPHNVVCLGEVLMEKLP